MLPLDPLKKRTYGLMGPAIHHPAGSGGGSADLRPYYLSRPLEAICEVVGEENVKTAVGCRGHLFTPLLVDGITVPGSTESGYLLEWFDGNPEEDPDLTPLHTARSTQAQMYFADSVPRGVPPAYVLRVRTVLTAEKSATLELGLCVIGRGKLSVDGDELIDLWTQHPEKTLPTPMFDQSSMEVVAELDVEAGRRYAISILLKNEGAVPGVGALQAGGLRVGCYEKVDPARALREAIELARQVDVPIVVAGLNADYESEAVDRTTLALPPAVDELIAEVLQANPNTIVVTQAGSPIAMPWLDRASTLVHAWFGGQETGHAMADVLFGRSNPSGRLSVSFPKRLEDTPAFLTWGKTDRHMFYGEGVFLGYRYYEKLKNPPLFYFGYGLSYTTFEYAHLTVPESVRFDDPLDRASFEVTVDVSNTGGHDGWEIVQVYVADRQCSVLRPVKELKGFAKVWIERSTTATVRVALDKYALSFWSEEEDRWVAEKGVFEVIVARSADPDDEVLRQEFRLEEDFSWSGL
ncbi:hypothetical protein VTK73DRAFT_7200 [Phialemonium thermophilum]|uniref:beta-glucosidase n=1 Tax=Phialemonium thermophilum TaxID=223376 RepID=A0ABR3WG35_9PEZI